MVFNRTLLKPLAITKDKLKHFFAKNFFEFCCNVVKFNQDSSYVKYGEIDLVALRVVRGIDNWLVLPLKTFKSAELFSKVKQYDQNETKEIEVECSSAISIYNGDIFAVDFISFLATTALDFISKNCIIVWCGTK